MNGFANLTKSEKLSLFEVDIKSQNLILIDETPYPGYYSFVSEEVSQQSQMLFLVLKPIFNFMEDKILRLNCKIKSEVEYQFDAT